MAKNITFKGLGLLLCIILWCISAVVAMEVETIVGIGRVIWENILYMLTFVGLRILILWILTL